VNKKLLGSVAALGLLFAGSANAVPCGWFGVAPSSQCRDGTGVQDSAEVINAGGYFGTSNWQLLDRVDTHGDLSNPDFWSVKGAARGLPAGSFALAEGIWNSYSKLAVALKGGGAWPVGAPAGTPEVNWSLYELPSGTSLYDWVYGQTRSGVPRNLFTITLYGIGRTVTTVAEPGTIALLLIGAAALGLASRRKVQATA
jgi:hypothetical protein